MKLEVLKSCVVPVLPDFLVSVRRLQTSSFLSFAAVVLNIQSSQSPESRSFLQVYLGTDQKDRGKNGSAKEN